VATASAVDSSTAVSGSCENCRVDARRRIVSPRPRPAAGRGERGRQLDRGQRLVRELPRRRAAEDRLPEAPPGRRPRRWQRDRPPAGRRRGQGAALPPGLHRLRRVEHRRRVQLAEGGVVHLRGREREDRVADRRDARGARRARRGDRRGAGRGRADARRREPQPHELEGGFPRRIEPEQAAEVGVDEPRQDPRREPEQARRRQHVCEHRPRIPEEMAVGARLVLPGVAPVDRREHERRRPARQLGLGGRVGEGAPIVPRAEPPQAEVARREVIDPGAEPLNRSGDDVHLGLVEGARRRRRAKAHLLSAGIGLRPRETGGEEEDRGERAEGERPGGGRRRRRERGQGVARQGVDRRGEQDLREIRIDLERERLHLPVEGVAARPDRRRGVRGPVVERASDLDVPVRPGHYWVGARRGRVRRSGRGGGRRRAP